MLQYLGYGVASVAYSILTLLLVLNYRGPRAGMLATATFCTAVWTAALCWGAISGALIPRHLLILEMLFDAAWFAFLAALFSGLVGERHWVLRFGGFLLVAALLLAGIYSDASPAGKSGGLGIGTVLTMGSIFTSLFGLVLIEQIYRNAREVQRVGLRFIALGVGGIFAFDLVLYSNAILVGQISEILWATRGVFLIFCAPLIFVAAQRLPSWSAGIFVSRHVVFYSATLFGGGVYLTAIGFVGYYLREASGEWGAYVQIILTSVAVLALFVFFLSDRARRNLRVVISKHFFENKYDYRDEWMRLISTLTSDAGSLPLPKRSIKALAQILHASNGVLWLGDRTENEYSCAYGWNCPADATAIRTTSSLVAFLGDQGWVVDVAEYVSDPARYGDLEFERSSLGLSDVGFIVPLFHDGHLLGFVTLPKTVASGSLNFEDYDLLKTAGQQIAGYLAQEIATEKLAEVRQFEAFNRLTAYLMHDLKNVIAQQSLIVDNAEKHKNKPEFVDDVIATIESSVRRMRRIIEHLQQGKLNVFSQRVELGKLIMLAVTQTEDKQPTARAQIGDVQVWVLADPDRLQMALYHAIRNAQDATKPDGCVNVTLATLGKSCRIEVVDDGSGMDEKFVRERLFKPFDSTKGTQGMGIGAYQLRETVIAAGGGLSVDTSPGRGTRIRIDLPLAE